MIQLLIFVLQLTFWTLLKHRIMFQIQPSEWIWTMQVFWKRIGMEVHIPVLWSGFLPFYAWQSQVPRLSSQFAFVNSLNLTNPPRSLLTELGNGVNREDTNGPKLHIIQSERPKSRLCFCYECASQTSSCHGMLLSLKPPNNAPFKNLGFRADMSMLHHVGQSAMCQELLLIPTPATKVNSLRKDDLFLV